MSKQRTYTGYSGQMAVMAELLFRQCNVAVPAVDWGTDLLAFSDRSSEIARLQIKTGQGERYKTGDGYSVQFDLPVRQLQEPDEPVLSYILVARLENHFADFLIVSRKQLLHYWDGPARFGTENRASGNVVLTVQFRPATVRCGEVDLTPYRNAWDRLPPFQPPVPASAAASGEAAPGGATDESATP